MSDQQIRNLLKQVSAELVAARRTVAQLQAERSEPIAIVGMACRYPAGVTSPEDLWSLVEQGRDAIAPFPTDRGWRQPAEPDTYPPCGGFLDEPGHFDAAFFGMSPRAATATDPQHRLLLETAWETFERSMISPAALQGSRTGVFIGLVGNDYGPRLHEAPPELEGHLLTGTFSSVASGRIAYTFGLTGPALTVDTACSSSLTAVHLACRSLRSGESDLALAGGSAVMTHPGLFVEFGRQRGLAGDGRCKAFADSADGTNWSEGTGLVLLERLRDARANGHRVLAVIRGSAANQDGASADLSAPSGTAQQAVIRAAWADAGLTGADIDLVEAHGTGTRLGDPVEAQALLATYGRGRPVDDPVWLGTLKSNIGHASAAAGIGGVIKAVMAIRHGVLPRSLHAEPLSTRIDWDSGSVRVLAQGRPWPDRDGPRRAGVSAFGVSGTNVHVVLEGAPDEPDDVDGAADAARLAPVTLPYLVSARTPAALRAQAMRLAAHMDGADHQDTGQLVNTAFSLAVTRAQLRERAVVVAASGADLGDGLHRLVRGEPAGTVVQGRADADGKIAFVFPGQGSQWPGMAVELLASSPVFRRRLHECADALAPWLDWSPIETLLAAPSGDGGQRADSWPTDVVQPLLWAVMVSLAEVWRSFGVEPDGVIGHSQGEIAAACVAGLLSLDDAARLVAGRSQLVTRLPGRGAMASVPLPLAQVLERMAPWQPTISVAAVNSPSQVVVSGDADALTELVRGCQADGIEARWVDVSYASHSWHMDAAREELLAGAANCSTRPAQVPMMSTVTSAWVDGRTPAGPVLDGAYWFANLREPVQLAAGIETMAAQGFRVFIEVSPHPVLLHSLRETLEQRAEDADPTAVVATLRRGEGGLSRVVTALAQAHVRGVDVRWEALFEGSGARPVDLPTYAFERRRFWLDPSGRTLPDAAPAAAPATTPAAAQPAAVDRLRRHEEWSPLPDVRSGPSGGRWLALVPTSCAADPRVGAVLVGLGPDAVRWDLDDTDLAEPGRWGERLRAATGDRPDGTPVSGIVSLLALAVDSVVADVLDRHRAVVQAWAGSATTAPLWWVTSGAVAVTATDPVRPEQTALWGLGRVAALEHPDRWGGLVDLPPGPEGADAAGRLAAVLAGTEDQVALRAGGAFARRLQQAGPASDAAPGWRTDGTVLVTGGTGGVGAVVAAWAVRRGARHVVLVGRRGPQAPGAQTLAAELTALGARVSVQSCDVADRVALGALLEALAAEPPLTAVFHAAGVLADDCALDELTPSALRSQLAVKATAADALHELTAGRALDAFVLFSSGAAAWGATGQGGYAAANAYLDGLAQQRRSAGLVATSIAWGAWGTAGMAQDDRTRENLRRRGVLPLDPAAALAALEVSLVRGEATATVADLDLDRFVASFTARRPSRLFGERAAIAPAADDIADPAVRSPLLQRLSSLDGRERRRVVLDLVRDQAAAILGHPGGSLVEEDVPFREAGFDSVTAVDLADRLRAAAELPLPSTVIFSHPTPRRLAEHLVDRWSAGVAGPAAGPVPAITAEPAPDPTDDPIVIAGMACRFPGGIDSPAALWELIRDGRAVSPAFPQDRGWDLGPLQAITAGGSFLTDIAGFDAAFFGISPREALTMDPQQRLLLQVVWEALERATIRPDALSGTSSGVFVGAGGQDYAQLARTVHAGDGWGHALTGTAASVLSGRIAYVLGLEGPAVTVDTACSSSLSALHLALRALRAGECDLAVAGGVTLLSTSDLITDFAQSSALAADGRCKPFSAAADGIGCAEGVGAVVLERLSRARQLGHPVLAVVRGSAMNQDGASNGLSAPNGQAQERVIARALADAGLRAEDVDLVEAHGTGTTLGDPIEAQALQAAYGTGRSADRPVWFGSVKSNLGHPQAAAGMAGVLKAVLALQHGVMPATLHAQLPSTHVDWQDGLRLLTQARPWPDAGRPRRAAVSSFGISGTNTHVVLEAAPAAPLPAADAPGMAEGQDVPWVLSGREAPALQAMATGLAGCPAARPDADPMSVAWSLLTTRAGHRERAVVVGRTAADFDAGLGALAQGRYAAHVVRGSANVQGRTAFVFPGHGPQWAGMAADLLQVSPVFARRLGECAQALAAQGFSPLLATLDAPAEADVWRDEAVVQPLLWAVMVALADVWTAHGVVPDAVVGHSLGEVAAATVAGALTLDDGARVAVARSRAVQALSGRGGLVVVPCPRAEVEHWLGAGGPAVEIAACNGPRSVVLTGAPAELARVVAHYAAQGVTARAVAIDYPAHSAQIDEVREAVLSALAALQPTVPRIPVLSAVTADWVRGEAFDAEHWFTSLRRPVEFEAAVRRLADEGFRSFIEVSTHPVLVDGMAQTVEATCGAAEPVLVTGTLRRGDGGLRRLLLALAETDVRGHAVRWEPAVQPRPPVPLPTYPFQPRRYWIDPAPVAGPATARPEPAGADDVLASPAVPVPRGLEEVLRARPQDRSAAVRAVVRGQVAVALGTSSAELDDRSRLQAAGLDSLITMQLRTMLTTELGVRLPLVTFQDAGTVEQLADLILPMLGEPVPVPVPVAEPELLPVPLGGGPAADEPFELTDLQHAYVVGRSDALAMGQIPASYAMEIDLQKIDLDRLADAFDQTVRRHEMLRAVITPDGRQRVLPDVPRYEFEVTDLRDCTEQQRRRQLEEIGEQLRERVSDPGRWPLFEIKVSLLPDERVRLHLGYELLIADGWSTAVWFHDWAAFYRGAGGSLPALGFTFREYLGALEAQRRTPGVEEALAYWRARAQTLPAAPALPLAKDPGTVDRPQFRRRAGRLDAQAWSRFQACAAAAGVSASAALCAVYAQVIAGWSSSPRFTLTVVAYNRPPVHPDIRLVVGSFTTTVLLEIDSDPMDRFAQRAVRLQRQLWSDLDHLEISGVQALREINRGRADADRLTLPVVFASTVNFSSQSGEAGAGGAAASLGSMAESFEVVSGALRTPQVWLDHQLIEEDGELVYNWDAVDEIFPAGMIDEMFAAYREVLHGLACDESLWDRPAPVLAGPADLEVRAAANRTAGPLPTGLLHDDVLRMAREQPGRPAVITPERTLTYGELDTISTQVAHLLRHRGAGAGALVAVVMDRGWEQVVACLAILKAGAGYVPIDAAVPAGRLRLLMASAGLDLAVTQARHEQVLGWPPDAQVLTVDGPQVEQQSTEPLAAVAGPQDLAYVIYTSGSTGVPKGVMIEHCAALNTVRDINERFGVTADDRVLGLSALNFDLSVYDIFGLLSAGGALVLPEPQAQREPARWAELVSRHGVTMWNTVPKLMEMLVEHLTDEPAAAALPLRLVMLSGDWIPVTLPDRIRGRCPQAQVWSLGGATEAAIWSIAHPVGSVDPDQPSIPYGKPLLNQRFHVLNQAMQPCPSWVTGALYIAGAGLARGYLADEVKTRKSFVRHPATGEKLYATGDLGRYLPDGNIEFLGRSDLQVKIHGHRIELGEVEAALLRCPGVREAAAAVTGDRHGGRRLVGYVSRDPAPEQGDLRDLLRQELPDYLVPRQVIELDRLPLSANGKVDRAALPAPDHEGGPGESIVEPRDAVERQLAEIWAGYFTTAQFGVTTSFFDLGGDSLLGVRLMARIAAETGRQLQVSTLFRRPTIELLAQALREAPGAAVREAVVTIQDGGSRPPLFLVHPVGGDVLCYAELARLLGSDQPVHGVQVPDWDLPSATVPQMAEHYARAVRDVAGAGPLRLGGWSMGGVLALEVGRQLVAAGVEVELVAVIDVVEPPGAAATVPDDAALLAWFGRDLAGLVGSHWAPDDDLFRSRSGRSAAETFHRQAVAASVLPADTDPATYAPIIDRFTANARALLTHSPEPFPGRARFFRGRDGGVPDADVNAWRALCGPGTTVVEVPGDHYTMMRKPQVSALAAALAAALREIG